MIYAAFCGSHQIHYFQLLNSEIIYHFDPLLSMRRMVKVFHGEGAMALRRLPHCPPFPFPRRILS